MNKDFNEAKLLSFSDQKIFKVLYDLACFIEKEKKTTEDTSFLKLKKYHLFLQNHSSERIQKLNKEFFKIQKVDYQFQVYLMNLERLLGQSKKEYDFLTNKKDELNAKSRQFEFVCVLDSVRSAHNVGAMFRNAECFGVKKILLCGLSPQADHPQVIKTAMGSHEKVNWSFSQSAVEALKELKSLGYTILAIETTTNAIKLDQYRTSTDKLAIVFGHEQFGVSSEILEMSDEVISIELFGQKNSLNVSVCQGIVLNSLVSKLK